MRREDKPLASIVREALDAYLDPTPPNREVALASTFGSIPDLDVPARQEWERG